MSPVRHAAADLFTKIPLTFRRVLAYNAIPLLFGADGRLSETVRNVMSRIGMTKSRSGKRQPSSADIREKIGGPTTWTSALPAAIRPTAFAPTYAKPSALSNDNSQHTQQ